MFKLPATYPRHTHYTVTVCTQIKKNAKIQTKLLLTTVGMDRVVRTIQIDKVLANNRGIDEDLGMLAFLQAPLLKIDGFITLNKTISTTDDNGY